MPVAYVLIGDGAGKVNKLQPGSQMVFDRTGDLIVIRTTAPGLPIDLAAVAAQVTGVLPTANGGTSVDIASAALPLGSGQIQFPATQNPSAGANVLDDYEEGTWTPVVTFGGATTGITYETQAGRYTKIGRMVYCLGLIALTSKGSAVGVAAITGAPFANSTQAGGFSSAKVSYTAFAVGVQEVGLQTAGGASAFDPVKSVAGVNTVLADTDFTNTSTLVMYICYTVD